MVFLLTSSLLSAVMFALFFSAGGFLQEALHFQNEKNITAEPGQNVTLPCRAPDGKPVVAFEWSRADLGSELVFLYRNEQIDLEDQHPLFKNRVDLRDGQLKDGDMSIVLRNTTTDDRGTYQCQVVQTVTNRRMKTVFVINLEVHPPPGEPDGGTNIVPVCVSVSVFVIVAVVSVLIFKKHSKPNHSVEPPGRQKPLMDQNGLAESSVLRSEG